MNKKTYTIVLLLLGSVFLVLHLLSLTALPVFADESIYIRWAQLIISDSSRYLFFPLNDGKTPLFIWMLAGVLPVFSNPLLAGRVLAVVVGLAQVFVLMQSIRTLGGSKRAEVLGAIGVILLPFWYFHHRMALMDGLLTLFLSLAFLVSSMLVMRPLNLKKTDVFGSVFADFKNKRVLVLEVVLGVFLGLALWTKLPAVLFIPSLFSVLLALPQYSTRSWAVGAVRLLVGLGVGVAVFSLLLLHPAAPQLFSRGSDFLFSSREISLGYWWRGVGNIPSYMQYFLQYLTPGVLALSILGFFFKKQRKTHLMLSVAFLLFFLPIAVLGKVVYPRYFLPLAIFTTIGVALTLDSIFQRVAQVTGVTRKKIFLTMGMALLVANSVTASFAFMYYSIVNPDAVPFVAADRQQYLTEWSSGHGITEAATEIEKFSKTGRLAVATEGFFGTLPDALLMYFENKNHDSLLIEGIGQPVAGLPTGFVEKAQEYDTVWLVVNDYRMLIKLPPEKLLYEYCRPFAGPCLQVWDVGEVVGR